MDEIELLAKAGLSNATSSGKEKLENTSKYENEMKILRAANEEQRNVIQKLKAKLDIHYEREISMEKKLPDKDAALHEI